MKNIKDWLSNKENIKILVMAGLAVLLVFVLKHRYSKGEDSTQSSQSVPYYEKLKEKQTGV